MPSRLVPIRLWQSDTLVSGGSLETPPIDLRNADPDHLALLVDSASGTADVKVEVAFSDDGVTFNNYDDQDPIVASTAVEWTAGHEESPHDVSPIPRSAFIRLQLTDLSASETLVTGTLWIEEND